MKSSEAPRRHRPGWDIKFRRPRPYHTGRRLLVLLRERQPRYPTRPAHEFATTAAATATTTAAASAADIFLTKELT